MLSKVLLTLIVWLKVLKSQSTCVWYDWSQVTGYDDWPDGTTQNFSQLIGDAYLDSNDFATGGRFEGQSWKTKLYTDVTYWRPLGYKYAQLGGNNDPTVCIKVNGTQGYKVELMVYTITSGSNICVTDMSSDKFSMDSGSIQDDCASQYLYKCFTADTTTNQLNVALYCKTGCSESPTDLLFRFRRSNSQFSNMTGNSNPEMWCMTIASNVYYPDSITSSTPNNYVNQNNNLFSSAFGLSIKISLFIVVFLWIIS